MSNKYIQIKKSEECLVFLKTQYKNNKLESKRGFDILLSDCKFNENTILYNHKLSMFLSKNFFGISKHLVNLISIRVEISPLYSFGEYSIDRWLILNAYLANMIPSNKSIKDKLLLNLTFLYLIRSYRGWRHSFNLPVRGQRTWSNAAAPSKIKNMLREYKFNCFKSGLVNAHPDEVKNAFYLEQLNSLWKWQWEKEWLLAFKKRQSQLKKSRGLKKLELSVLAKTNPNFTKSKKQTIVPIGFESGFTRNYLKEVKQFVSKKNNIITQKFSNSIINSYKKTCAVYFNKLLSFFKEI